MSKKPSGLAAFTRPKATIDDQTAIADRPSVEPPAPRRKRGGGETVALTVKLRRADWRRLRELADTEATTIQALAEAGFSAVLAQHGLPPIDPHTR